MPGGYKYKRVQWAGNTIGSTFEERCANVLKLCAQALIDMNVGWSLDTSFNATTNNYLTLNGDVWYTNRSGSYQYEVSPCYALILQSTAGAKLALIYRYGFPTKNSLSSSASRNAIPKAECAGKLWNFGLVASIIPPNAGVNFTYDSSEHTLTKPLLATPYIGTGRQLYVHGTGDNFSSAFSFAALDYSASTFTYHLISNGTNIIVMNNSTDTHFNGTGSGYYSGYVVGNIISAFTNAGDTYGYGCFSLSDCARTYYGSGNYHSTEAFIQNNINQTNSYFVNTLNSDNTVYRSISYMKADGSAWLTSMFENAGTSSSSVIYGPWLFAFIAKLYLSISAHNRSVPMLITGQATVGTLTEYGVTNDTCIKGTIDPDLACQINPEGWNQGQTFNNKSLIHVGAGLCLGWDISNTSSIFEP